MADERSPESLRNYRLWATFARIGYWEMTRLRNEVPSLAYRPRVSILVPVYNPAPPWLERALDSVISQIYPEWELCICDDGSTESHVKETLRLYERLDERIKVRYLDENVGIVGATNQALSLATGEFVGMLDHDDELAPNALFEVVKFLQERPDADLIYSDEDKIDENGERVQPHFKLGWSQDLAMSCNYLNHFSVYRRAVLEELGGWRESFDGAQDLELVQRYGERTDRIYHIPKVLYHWRQAEGSTAVGAESKPYTHERARQAVKDLLRRTGIAGSVENGFAPNTFRVEREIIGEPTVSVIVPSNGPTPERLIESLRSRTSYPNYEITSVDLTRHPESDGQQAAGQPEEPSVSELCNAAIQQAEGEYVVMLDPSLETVSDGWLEAMLQHAQRSEVGAVGAKLTLPSGKLFHGGLVLHDRLEGLPEDRLPRFYRYCTHEVVGYRHYYNLTRNCSAVSSACMMFRKDTFEELGGFDAAHFGREFADVDLSLRMRENGRLIVFTPYAEFTYHGPLPRHTDLTPAEAGYIRQRWGHVLNNDPYYNPNLAWEPTDPLATGKNPRPAGNGGQQAQNKIVAQPTEASPSAGASPPPPIPDVKVADNTSAGDPQSVEPVRKPLKMPPPFFVVGHGRSGTTWLEQTLNSHPEVLCKGSGMFFGRNMRLYENQRTLYAVLANSEDLKTWHDMRPNYWSERPFEEDVPGMVKALADHTMGTELRKTGKKIAGDRTPHHVKYLEEVHALYPDSKVVHIIRDGRDVAISNLHAVWQNARDRGGPVDLEPEVIEKRDAYLENREAFLKSGESIFTDFRVKQLAKSWNEAVSKGREDGQRLFGDHYMEIRYEDLLRNPESELERLFEFLGVNWNQELIERIIEENSFERIAGRPRGQEDSSVFHRKGVAGDWKEVFNEQDKKAFGEVAGDLLSELGYEDGDATVRTKPATEMPVKHSSKPKLPPSRNLWATTPPFFVVGHGRSGTTWSERLLNSHPEVLCKGSGMFFGRTIGLFEGRKTLYATLANLEDLRLWHDMVPNYWSERPFEEDVPGMVRALTDHTLKTGLDNSDKKIVGDRTPHYAQFLEEIHDLYPASKIIHVVRDGRDVAISNLHAFWNSARDRGGPIDLAPEELERRDAYLKDGEAFLKSGKSIFTESRIRQLSSSWNRLINKARNDGQRLFGSRYMEIRYEHLLEEPHAELGRVFTFLNVSWDKQMVDQIIEANSFEKGSQGRSRGEEDTTSFLRKGIHGDWKNVFNERDRKVFGEVAGGLLVELGYERDMDW